MAAFFVLTEVQDTGARDTGANDTGANDTGVKDTGMKDTGMKDTGMKDTGMKDKDKGEPGLARKVPEYLVLFTEPKDGQPFDFNQIRVFTWNGKRHRYETAYREHKLNGVLPASVGREDFGKEGTLPTFTLHVRDKEGAVVERKYKLNGPIVRLVKP